MVLLSWRPTTPVGERPHGRQGATLTRLGDRFVLFGGATDTGPLDAVEPLAASVRHAVRQAVARALARTLPPRRHLIALVAREPLPQVRRAA